MFDYLEKDDKRFAIKVVRILGGLVVVGVGIYYFTKAAIFYHWMSPQVAVCLAIASGSVIALGVMLWTAYVVGNRAADVAEEGGWPKVYVLIARNFVWIVVIGMIWSTLKFYHFV